MKTVKPLIDKARSYSTAEDGDFSVWYEEFSTESIKGTVALSTMSFGSFGGNLTILQGTIVDDIFKVINEYYSDLTISLDLIPKCYVTLYQNTDMETATSSTTVDVYEVDKNMNIKDINNHTQESLKLYETNRDVINELRAELVRRFGEENLFN